MKNRILTFLLIVSLLTQCCAVVLAQDSLSDPVDVSASVASEEIVLERADGSKLTLPNGGTKLLVFGRTTCGNTIAFMSGIRDCVSKLSQSNVKVIVGLFDSGITPDMITDFEDSYPGIIAGEHIYGMWDNLYAMGWSGSSVTFPVIFIQDGSGKLRYYSTGYVNEPLRVAGGAIAVAEGTVPEEPDQPQQDQPQESGGQEQVTLKKVKISKLTAVSKKKINVEWKKLSSKDRKKIKQIQVQVATDKAFENIVSEKFVKASKASVTVSGLKKNMKYYVRIRAYTEDGAAKLVSPWSSVKKIKTKKK